MESRGLGRRIALWLGGALLGPVALVAAAVLLLQTAPAKDWLATTLSGLASEATGFVISIGRIEGAVPTDFTVASLQIADADGVWLEAEDLALDWWAVALLRGRLDVERLAARRLTIARAPLRETSEPAAIAPTPLRIELPSLPLELAVRELSIGEIRLGAALIGEEAAATVSGNAVLGARPQDAEISLTLERLDGSPGRASLQLRQDPPEGALTLAVAIEEPAGGIIARLLDLPDLPAVSLRLDGAGPVTAWQGRLDAAAGDAVAGLDLNLAIDDRLELAVAGNVDPGGLAGAGLRELLPRPIAIDAALGWVPGETLEIGHADLSASGLEATLQGRLDQSAQTIDATAALTASDPAWIARLADPVAARSLRLTARATGNLLAPAIEIAGAATQVAAPDVSAEAVALQGRIAPARQPSRLDLTARIVPTGLALSVDPALATLIGDAPVVALDGVLDPASGDLDIATLDVTGAAVTGSGRGRVAAAGRDVDLSLTLRLNDIAPLGGLAGLPVAGALDADLRLYGDATVPMLAVDLEARGAAVSTDDALLAALIGPTPHFVAAATLDGSDVTIDSATLSAAAAQVRASGTAGRILDLQVEATAADIAPLSGPLGIDLAGSLALDGRITGPAADPAIALRLDGTRMAAAGIALGDPTAEATIGGLAALPRGKARLTAAPGGVALTAATGFRLTEAGGMRLEGLAIDGRGTRLAGDLAIGADGLMTGALDGRVSDLAAWQGLAGTELAGAADLQLSLSAARGAQRIEAGVTGSGLGLARTATLRSIRLDLDITDALGAPLFDGNVAAQGVEAGGLAFDDMGATAKGPLSGLDWMLTGTGAGDPDTRIDSAGRLAVDQGGLVTVARLDTAIGPVEARLAKPARVAWGGGAVEIADMEALIGGGRISAAARVAPGELALDAALADLPLMPLLVLAGAGEIDGRVSGSARLRGDPAQPNGEVTLILADLREVGVDPAEAIPLSAEIAAGFADGRVDATAALGGADEIALQARLSAPMAADGPLDGQIAGTIDLALVPKVVDLRGDALSGRLDVDLAIGGSLADPEASGRAGLSGGAYESATAGTVLRDLTAEIVGDEDSLRLVSLTAGDGNGGKVTASGGARLDADAGFPVELEAAFDRFTALRRREATVQGTGRVNLVRDAAGGRIGGTVTVDSAELRIPDRLGTEIVTLEVTEVNRPAGQAPRQRPAPAAEAPLHLDVKVDVPGRAFLRGRGLDSEWRGKLQVGGTTAAPDVTGELHTVRGTLDLLGRNFRFDQGSVRFVGGDEIDPELAFTAESEAEALTVRAEVSGTASAPSFALSSEPPLPQDEILARLLFGASTGTLTPIQAVQLAQTAATLSGRGGAGSVVDTLRQGFGLDMLGVETGDSLSGSSLAIGKYIADDVFVRMNQGVTPESRRVGVEVRVLPRVTVESDIGAQSQGNVGVNWKLDY